MSLLASVLLIANCAGPCAQERVQTQLAELVAAVRSADYRGASPQSRQASARAAPLRRGL